MGCTNSDIIFFIKTSVDANVLYGLNCLKLSNACLIDSTIKLSENIMGEGTKQTHKITLEKAR